VKTDADREADASRARAVGKARVAASVVWELTVGELRFRCLPKDGRYELQARLTTGWKGLTYDTDPLNLLQRAARSGSVERSVALMVDK